MNKTRDLSREEKRGGGNRLDGTEPGASRVVPLYPKRGYTDKPPSRRPRRLGLVLTLIFVVLGGITVYSGFLAPLLSHLPGVNTSLQSDNGGVTIVSHPAVITPGQINIADTVTYTDQYIEGQESITVTDNNVQDCAFVIFGCQAASDTQTVYCKSHYAGQTDYIANPPQPFKFGPNRTVTIVVSPPQVVFLGYKTVRISDSSTKYGVPTKDTNDLITKCGTDTQTAAQQGKVGTIARQEARKQIQKDAARYGFTATVIFTDEVSPTPTPTA